VPLIDVVIVSFNSREHLRDAVEPLVGITSVHVIVVDNASQDGSLDTIADLPVTRVPLSRNRGFAHGCNAGLRKGSAPFVLFLNPDACMNERSLRSLADVLEHDSRVGAVAPKILYADGSLAFYQRRFPRLVTTYARAFFLHRLFSNAAWASEEVSSPQAYLTAGSPDWVPATCLLTRREVVEQLAGFDEVFFMYCEDKDLCRRMRVAGFDVRYEPAAVCRHVGGASAPRASLLPVLAASRVRYAEKHGNPVTAFAERIGLALEALTHAAMTRRGRAARLGYVRAFAEAMRRR
jgi:N-acetylglucosaminyl-diphospho-decaprenol L-rhamnosyltransferase